MLSPWHSLLSPTSHHAIEMLAPPRPANRFLHSSPRSQQLRSVTRAAPTLSATATAVSSQPAPKKKVWSPLAISFVTGIQRLIFRALCCEGSRAHRHGHGGDGGGHPHRRPTACRGRRD